VRTSASTSCPVRSPFSPAAGPEPDPAFAADVVWLDALVTNVDRMPQNPNLLWWHDRLWLIDHGAALYWHHAEAPESGFERSRFPQVRDHVLLPYAGSIADADARLAPSVTDELLQRVVMDVPDAFLDGDDRAAYVDYLRRRLESPRDFVEEAEAARA
jgi:hypothetical protein